ncbi:3-dehydroquinate synthase [Anatilimnocola aggregata]|uniref:3-dehydroquinate synthase n=1 Tax=Anatilimnocola aggregata TaxID=2528021 RepID=A0A517YHK5_9BACT|nr:3-dehydroquinate synthase [Anatilimnocola aggregata]QDU29703.1 3-dehydroquinate synthase [Anatilimnocola aggregata]
MKLVRVNLGPRAYDIEVASGQLAQSASFFQARHPGRHAVLICDANVRAPYGEPLAAALSKNGYRCNLLAVPAGEATKCTAQAEMLWNSLLECRTDRKSVVIAVGGGVVGDLAGFVAATFGRGLAFFQVPTTLLAQVDSSVGGKVGINLPAAKNMVGSFWQPTGVVIDLAVLQSLPRREYVSGLAEVVKYGMILDATFFEYLESVVPQLLARDEVVLERVVARCCELKAQVVEQDEREESGLRAVLNYGHTFCHAIETVSGYGRFLHGEAVAIGMVQASQLAENLNRIEQSLTMRQLNLLQALELPTTVAGLDPQQLLAAMQHDKKVEHGKLRFVLPTRMGHVELVSGVSPEVVLEVLQS